jgi:hypothetical protein
MAIVFDAVQYFSVVVGTDWTTLCTYTPATTLKSAILFVYSSWGNGWRCAGQDMTLIKDSGPGSSLKAYQLVNPPAGTLLMEAKAQYVGQFWRGGVLGIEGGYAAGQSEGSIVEGFGESSIEVTLSGKAGSSKALSLFFGEFGGF